MNINWLQTPAWPKRLASTSLAGGSRESLVQRRISTPEEDYGAYWQSKLGQLNDIG